MGTAYAPLFLDALFMQPVFSTRTIRKLVQIKTIQTLYNLIVKFKQAGIISDLTRDQKRNKIYRFDALHDILRR